MRELIGMISGFILILFNGCSEKEIPVVNESNMYSECDSKLISCAGDQVGEYCIFGYKWVEDQNFDEVGVESLEPRTAGETITFSFQKKNGTVNTHRQVNVPSKFFQPSTNADARAERGQSITFVLYVLGWSKLF